MKLRVTNNRKAPYGIEEVGGGFKFVDPGETRAVDAVNPGPLYRMRDLVVEAADSEVADMPASLKAKAGQDPLDHDGDGKRGGSKKGPASTRARGARRRKAARK